MDLFNTDLESFKEDELFVKDDSKNSTNTQSVPSGIQEVELDTTILDVLNNKDKEENTILTEKTIMPDIAQETTKTGAVEKKQKTVESEKTKEVIQLEQRIRYLQESIELSNEESIIDKRLNNLTRNFVDKIAPTMYKAGAILLSEYQMSRICKKFEQGKVIITQEFKLLLHNGELMLYEYAGCAQDIIMPDTVGNVPVRYIHPNVLHSGGILPSGFSTVKQIFKNENVEELSIESLKEASRGIKSIQLPKYLRIIPNNVFRGCNNLQAIEVPEEVHLIGPAAFLNSGINQIYFSGKIPQNFNSLILKNFCIVFAKDEYATMYKEAVKNES